MLIWVRHVYVTLYPVSVLEQKDPAEPFDVEEVVQEMPRDQRMSLWGRLASLLQDILVELPPEHWGEDIEVESAVDRLSVVVQYYAMYALFIFVSSELLLLCECSLRSVLWLLWLVWHVWL